MLRYVSIDLKEWLTKQRRKPLLLRGARQVGKTWLVENLAREEFEVLVKMDFEENVELISLFDGDLDPNIICSELELRTGLDIVPGKTLLFLDEIQECPRAIMALRYFYEKMPGLHVIAAGSLLEFALNDISFPVGRIQSLDIQPMNFSEFLLALGFGKAAEICSGEIRDLTKTTHDFLIEQLRIYWLVGGMPESVKVYAETRSLKQAVEVQDEIWQTYRDDFRKYKPATNVSCLTSVFTGIAATVGTQQKYTGLAKDYTIPTIKTAYHSLILARVAKKVRSVGSPGIPLEVNASDKKFKSLFLDIGLMNRVMGIDYTESFKHENLLSIYRGQLAEQFIGQEFASATSSELFYWSREARNSNAEIDFLIQKGNDFIPIEVKDGPSGKLRSLHMYRNSYAPPYSIVFNTGPKSTIEKEKIVFLPLYYAASFALYGLA